MGEDQPGVRRRLRLTNGGDAPLTGLATRIEGAAAADFEVVDTTCRRRSVAPGETCAISLLFRPLQLGQRRARLLILSAELERHPVRLTGVGRPAPTPRQTRSPSPPPPPTLPPVLALTFEPDPVDFGSLSAPRATMTIVVRAVGLEGSEPVTVDAENPVAASGDTDQLLLSMGKCAGFEFTAPGQECVMGAVFIWTQGAIEGSYSATYAIRTSAGDYELVLLGTLDAVD
jgi:hypothetical protein